MREQASDCWHEGVHQEAIDLRALCDALEIVTRERNDALRVQIDGKGGAMAASTVSADTPSGIADSASAAQPDPTRALAKGGSDGRT